MKIEFKNGFKLKVVSDETDTKMTEAITYYQKYPEAFIKDCFPDICNNLHWYQKVYILHFILKESKE